MQVKNSPSEDIYFIKKNDEYVRVNPTDVKILDFKKHIFENISMLSLLSGTAMIISSFALVSIVSAIALTALAILGALCMIGGVAGLILCKHLRESGKLPAFPQHEPNLDRPATIDHPAGKAWVLQ